MRLSVILHTSFFFSHKWVNKKIKKSFQGKKLMFSEWRMRLENFGIADDKTFSRFHKEPVITRYLFSWTLKRILHKNQRDILKLFLTLFPKKEVGRIFSKLRTTESFTPISIVCPSILLLDDNFQKLIICRLSKRKSS